MCLHNLHIQKFSANHNKTLVIIWSNPVVHIWDIYFKDILLVLYKALYNISRRYSVNEPCTDLKWKYRENKYIMFELLI